jgi:hypothetical protein
VTLCFGFRFYSGFLGSLVFVFGIFFVFLYFRYLCGLEWFRFFVVCCLFLICLFLFLSVVFWFGI